MARIRPPGPARATASWTQVAAVVLFVRVKLGAGTLTPRAVYRFLVPGYFHALVILVAILFVIFDVEAMFLFPWAVVLKEIGLVGYIEMFVFIVLLLVGFAYAWLKGALEWEA